MVSFFDSNNLGDKLLSDSIYTLIKNEQYDVTKFDFLNMQKETENQIVNSGFSDLRTPNIFRKYIKNILNKFIGEYNLTRLIFLYRQNIHFRSNWKNFKSELENTEILIIGGGNMVMDIVPSWPMLLYRYAKEAKKMNKKVHLVYVGVGPIRLKQNNFVIRKTLKMLEVISVRDIRSENILMDIDPSVNVISTVDPVFLLKFINKEERESINNYALKNNTVKIGVCVLSEVCFDSKERFITYKKGLEALVRYIHLIDETMKFVFFSTEIMDYSEVNNIYKNFSGESPEKFESRFVTSLEDLKELYFDINFLIGGRMHSLILGQKFLLPSIGFIWQDKLVSFSCITNTENNMYAVEALNNIEGMSDKIFSLLRNKNHISNMDKRNEEIEKIAIRGLGIKK